MRPGYRREEAFTQTQLVTIILNSITLQGFCFTEQGLCGLYKFYVLNKLYYFLLSRPLIILTQALLTSQLQ